LTTALEALKQQFRLPHLLGTLIIPPGFPRPRGVRVAFLGEAPRIVAPGVSQEQEAEPELYVRMVALPPDLRDKVRAHLDPKLDAPGMQKGPIPKGKAS
jgi:hypothetical protein